MSKKVINQNSNLDIEFFDSIESNFIFNETAINRLDNTNNDLKENYLVEKTNKKKELMKLQQQINSIEDCSLKNNSTKVVLGSGNINSPIMLIGEAPGSEEEKTGLTFMGEAGDLLKKMLIAININKDKIYSTYSVNFRPPEDRKPTPT